MRYLIIFLSIFIFSISLTFSIKAKKLSKKNSEYTGKAIVEYDTMFNAGGWFMIMLQCEGTFAKTYKKKLGLLSWEDYKIFNAGHNKYAGGNYKVSKCDKNKTKEIKEWYDEILVYIKRELNLDNSNIESQITETKNNNQTNKNETIEEKLKQLKSLFEDDLITKEEYDTKRIEILDKM